MKYFRLPILLLLLSLLPFHAYAQSEMTPDTAEEAALYSKASTVQLEEAQRFYQRCRKNPILSKDKDCKCYSTKYLDARITLGSIAPITEILNGISDTCDYDEVAREQQRKEAEANKDNVDLSSVSDKDLKEAQSVFEACKANSKDSFHFDCECLGSTFLKERVAAGPWQSKDFLLNKIRAKSCPNVTAMTGREYTNCLTSPAYRMDNVNIEQEDFCTCYATRWGTTIESMKGKQLSQPLKAQVSLSAFRFCKEPTNYAPGKIKQ